MDEPSVHWLLPVRSVLPVFGAIALMSCAPRAVEIGPHATDRKLGPTAYYEQGQLTFLAVDSRPASFVKEGAILPIPFAIANRTKRSIHLRAEDFVLVDDQGNRYPLISYEEYKRGYRRLTADLKLAEPFYEATDTFLGLGNPMAAPYREEPFPFYGNGGLRRDSVELGAGYFTRGFFFFPAPPGGVKKRLFELHIHSKDLPQAVFVRFRVP